MTSSTRLRPDPAPGHTARPRLASDGHRYLWASVVTMLVSAAGAIATPRLRADGVGGLELAIWIYFGAWSLFCLAYAGLTWLVFRRADGTVLSAWLQETRTARERRRRTEWLAGSGGTSGAVSLCILAIAAVIGITVLPDLSRSPVVLTLAALVVGSSWLLIAVVYALHYAREHANLGGLRYSFDEPGTPCFADFWYLAVQVSASFSTADVTVTSSAMRRVVTAHTLVAFAFNTVLIALLVSLLVASP